MIALLTLSILATVDGPSAVIDCTRRTAPLFAAVAEGDVAKVRARVRLGDEVNTACDFADGGIGWPLEEALALRHVEIAHLLLDAGADPTRLDDGGVRALELAVELDSFELVDRVLRFRIDLDASSDGVPIVFRAVACSDLRVLDRLLGAGANPNAHFGHETALEIAPPPAKERLLAAGAVPGWRPSQQDRVVAATRRGQLTREMLWGGEVDTVAALKVAIDSLQPLSALMLAEGTNQIASHPMGCDVLVESARSNWDRVVRALLERNPNLSAECRARARAAARTRGEDSLAYRALTEETPGPVPSVPTKPAPGTGRAEVSGGAEAERTPSPAAPAVTRPLPGLCPARQADGATLCGLGISAEGGLGPSGPVAAVDLAAARARWFLAGDLLEVAIGYSLDRQAARLRASYGYFWLFFGAELGAAVRVPAPGLPSALAVTGALSFVYPGSRDRKWWGSASVNWEFGLDGAIVPALRVRVWRDLAP